MQQFIEELASLIGGYIGNWWIAVVSAVPIVELRLAIPLAIAFEVNPVEAFFLAVFGNMIPVIPVILLGRQILLLLKRLKPFKKLAEWVEKRTLSKKDKIEKYSMLGLCLLVALPLPGTGAWTGALLAALMDIRIKHAFPTIFLGVIIAGVIVTLISCGVAAI